MAAVNWTDSGSGDNGGTTPASDASLAAALRSGDPSALETIQTWIAQASSSFRRKLDFEWDDLQQQLFLEVLREIDRERWSGSGSLQGFVRSCVVHSCIDRIRYRQRWRHVSVDVLESMSPPRAGDRSGYLSLLDLARRLPEECRELWRMIGRGLSYSEMAERTGVREGTLRVRVLRCREKARALWATLETHRSPSEG